MEMCVEEEVGQLEGNVDGLDSRDWLPSPLYSGVCLELVGRGKLRLEGNITARGLSIIFRTLATLEGNLANRC
jgi:hypothetical protein